MKIDKQIIMNEQREKMITNHLMARGISDTRVLEAMKNIDRELFVPDQYMVDAYGDHPLPIGDGQTISQPYIVALMSQLSVLKGDEKVLEIGCGSGYQAAILSKLSAQVYSIERIKKLKESSESLLKKLGFENIEVILGDGYLGLPAKAPFDVILLTAAPDEIPDVLIAQLAPGGRLIAPVGGSTQKLIRITRTGKGIKTEDIIYVRFVPMVPGCNK